MLPPSEGKSAPARGRPLDPSDWPEALAEPRRVVLDALVGLCEGGDPVLAARTLGLGPSQASEISRNARLWSAPTRRADEVYAGVLYEALSPATLTPAARRRAGARVAIVSAAFGLVRPSERIPAYRLAGDVALPGVGRMTAYWRTHLGPMAADWAGSGLLVDLRSSTYAAFFRPPARSVSVRVLQEADGKRSIVSHFNKATKGRLVRDLLESGAHPRTPAALAAAWRDLGWRVESADGRLDVVVDEV